MMTAENEKKSGVVSGQKSNRQRNTGETLVTLLQKSVSCSHVVGKRGVVGFRRMEGSWEFDKGTWRIIVSVGLRRLD